MKFTTDKKTLLDALQMLTDAVPQDSGITSYNHVLLSLSDGDLSLLVTNYHSSASTKVECNGLRDGECCVHLNSLLKCIKPLGVKNEISIEHNDSKIILLSGKTKIELGSISIPIEPLNLDGNNKVNVNIESSDLFKGLNDVMFAAAPDGDYKSGMSGVRVCVTSDYMDFVALDGHVFSRHNTYNHSSNGEIEVTLHASRCKNILSFLKSSKDQEIKLEITDSKFKIMTENSEYISVLIGVDYPDWRRFTSDSDNSFGVNVDDLFSVVSSASSILNQDNRVKLTMSGGKIHVYSFCRENTQEFSSEIDAVYSGEDFVLNINPFDLLRGEKLFKGVEIINVQFTHSPVVTSPIKIPIGNSDNFFLFMPLKK